MSAGAIKADLTALVAVDMTGHTTGFFKVLSTGGTDYIYDSGYSGTFNSPFIVEHTGGGGGAWFASGTMTIDSTPSGIAEYPITVKRRITGSTGGYETDRFYMNGGGGSDIWRNTSILA
jgi:hypothetical protein